jgi:hypothetical protein
MKIPMGRHALFGILPALLLLLSGAWALAEHGGVGETIQNAMAPFDGEAIAHAVMSLPENTVPVETNYRGDDFRTEARKDKMERFQCSQCHNNKKNITINRAAQMAHGDIALVHGGKDKPLSCYTCHDKAERDFLTTETGVKIDMDHSYQMCGQCHFRQKKDWAGGAHGKRVDYWAGERVVKNCTSCHDPHSPLFKKRMPVTYSRPDK